MIQILTILVIASMLMRQQFPPLLYDAIGPAGAAILTLVPMAAMLLAVCCICWACRLELERRGSAAAVRWADHTISAGRWGAAIWHVIAVLGLGWLDAVRSVTGDLILIDEVIAGLPAIGSFVVGWWAIYPIDRLIREAAIVRALDEGKPLHAAPSRWTAVMLSVRHQMLLVLIPLTILAGWQEVSSRALSWVSTSGLLMALTNSPQVRNAAQVGLQMTGLLVVFTLMPLLMTVIWDTTPMGEGPTRSRLMDLCDRHGVRVRNLLVWRTRGSMLNGAVMGLLGRLRYVLLTDALLERLPEDQVEAVMAHEIGHVRRRHVQWLAACLLASIGLPLAAADAGVLLAGGLRAPPLLIVAFQLGVMGLCLLVGLSLFGWISRRFEWQADAFAVQHLSGHRTDGAATGADVPITAGAVASMAGALDAVAAMNSMPRRKFSWRHGSIHRRVQNLRALIGRPARGLRIDGTVRVIKLATAVALGLLAILFAKGF